MADITVHIMLHGLIALTPINGGNGQLNHMTALLADARQPRQEQCMNVKHIPTVTFRAVNQQCVALGCKVSSDDCTCELDFDEIKLTPDVQPSSDQIESRLPASLPFDITRATDFNYVANLASTPLGQTLNPEFLGSTPPSALVARMSFPFEVVKACSLATRRDEGSDNVHPMGFRVLGSPEEEGDTTQAVAQMFMAHYTFTQAGPEIPKLTLTLSDFNGGNPRSIDLLPDSLPNDGSIYFIRLENSRADLSLGDACDDGIARDFAHLYAFANNPPAWESRKVPHVKYTRWKSAFELLDPECRGPKTPLSRPVCPLGSFFPEQ
jgi:hypothetical protein